MQNRIHKSLCLLLILFILFLSTSARPFVSLITQDDLQDPSHCPSDEDAALFNDSSNSDWDEFGDGEVEQNDELDPGSWRPIFEPDLVRATNTSIDEAELMYYSGVRKMVSAVSKGESRLMEEAALEIEAAAGSGNAHAQSVLGFLFGMGMTRERNSAKAFTYHYFGSNGGNKQSQMALAYTYYRQNMHETAVKLYAELAKLAVNSFLISKDSPVLELVRIHIGTEENKEALRKSQEEEDEDFQILEYQAQKGDAYAMYRIGIYYYFGLRGMRRDHIKALPWFTKAAEKGEPRSMALLGEIYARGAGVERNYTKALEWLELAAIQERFSVYNGLGYLYVKGYRAEKNYTQVKIYLEKAANNKQADGLYNLGVMHLKGIGVKKDVKNACHFFIMAATSGQAKAFYQLAKMFHSGVGLKKNIPMATTIYKLVAEQGPWSSLSRWALESYLKGDVSTALLLYSRMAELGYEVAQSNAAWILDKYGEQSTCMGESGLCTKEERHQRAHSFWWQASEQGNENAALLIGDAYYYGRGTVRDYDRAAEAYLHAKSQSNAQAMFNLGYMHEHGQGIPLDLHLAKRYYDQALEIDPAANLPVTLALASLWVQKNYADTFLVSLIDALPCVFPKVQEWVEDVILEEGNATILALIVCLLTVLYFRERQRRLAAADLAHQPNDLGPPMVGNGL